MKIKSRIFLGFLVLAVSSLACQLFTNPPSAQPTAAETPLLVEPSVAPGSEPNAAPSSEPAPQPTAEINAGTNLPVGLGTVTEQTVSYYDLNGLQVSQVTLPQFTFPQRNRIHIAGSLPAQGVAVPLLYFSFDNGEALHFRDGNGQISALLSGSSFIGLTGVPGQPLVAFSQLEYLDTTLRSNLYAGSAQTLSTAAPVSVIDDPESWAIAPILLEAENGTPTKIWYTRTAYGIGGDIVFEPRKGLFVFDLLTGQESTVLDENVSPWAISADRIVVAYTSGLVPANSMCVKALPGGPEACFPALPAANEPRGAGNAVLSPDAQYVAWMEGDGGQMGETPTFTATVRVGQVNGTLVADLPMNTFESAAGIGPVYRADPVEWLDNQALIVQVRGQEWNQAVLLRYNIVSKETSYLAPGEFIGFLYP
jgi:hypothetical protein